MIYELEKANFMKRLSAWIFDGILMVILAVCAALLLSSALHFDDYNAKVTEAYEHYEEVYGTSFQVTQAEYEGWTDAQKQALEDASTALLADEDAIYNYHMTVNLIMIITSASILISLMVLELVIPLLLKNGQTLGKKIFGLCVVRTDCVRITPLQLAVRTVLGKAAIGMMIPVYLALMLLFGITGLPATVILLAILIGQVLSVAVTSRNAALHDLIAGTGVVDINTQMIFDSVEDKIEFQKKIHAEQAASADY